MKRRVRKLQKIARYFEQKKMMSVAELRKAGIKRSAEEKRLENWYFLKNDHMEDCVRAMSETIDLGRAARFHGECSFFDRGIEGQKIAVIDAVNEEKASREEVIRDSVTHNMWEKVVLRNVETLRRHIESSQGRTADDLALVHSRHKDADGFKSRR